MNLVIGDKVKMIVEFATVFHTLQHGQPMLEFESMKGGFLKDVTIE